MQMLDLWTAWPVTGPWQLTPLKGGTNNRIFRAETANGQEYVLRIVPDLTRISHIRYEMTLLHALADKQPPFRLPIPLDARNGESIVQFEQETGEQALAILMPLLPGHLPNRSPERDDPTIASNASTALAWLDRAMASLPTIDVTQVIQSSPPFGTLASWHPLVPDPLAAVELLPIDADQRKRTCQFLSSIMEAIPALYQHLPQQQVHRDCDPGNILVEGQNVTAVLDFEFAGRDLRALDLCVMLSWWPMHIMGSGKEWLLIDILGKTYQKHFPLDEEELLALSEIFQMRDATSLVHRMGRYLAGLETDIIIQNRITRSLWRDDWLAANRELLQQHALSWLLQKSDNESG